MRKHLFIYLFIPLLSFGQNHWVGIQGAYNFMGFPKSEFVRYERMPSFAAGLNYEWNYRNVAIFGFDILYNNTSYQNNFAYIRGDSNRTIPDTITYPSGTPYFVTQEHTADYNIHFISLPFKFGWHFGKKFRGFIIGGLGPTFALGGNAYYRHLVVNPNHERYQLKVQKGKGVGIMGQLEMGMRYIIKKRFLLYASALIYQHFKSPILEAEFDNPNYSSTTAIGGWGFQFSFGFKVALSKKPINEFKKKKKELEQKEDIYEELYLKEE